MRRRREPVGIVLAGGPGRRIGGAKATVALAGEPLISYPLSAMRRALADVAIVAKASTELPSLSGAALWIEPDEPRHPLTGLLHALALAQGRRIVVCPSDLPFVTPAVILSLARCEPAGAPAVIAAHGGASQPLLGCYQPAALALLAPVLRDGGELPPMGGIIDALRPKLLEVVDPDELFNVDGPDDLLQAAAMLDQRRTNRT